MKQSTCGAVFCQPGGDELKHNISTTGMDLLPLLRSVYMAETSNPFGSLLFLASNK